MSHEILYLVLAVMLTFLGYTFYKSLFLVFGAIVGALLACQYGSVALAYIGIGDVAPWIYLAGGAIIGLIFSAILRRAVLFLLGALLGLAIIFYVKIIAGIDPMVFDVYYIIAPIAGGLVALFLEKYIMIICSAGAGSILTSATLAKLIPFTSHPTIRLSLIIALFIMGILIQFKLYTRTAQKDTG